jgi:MFS family permease
MDRSGWQPPAKPFDSRVGDAVIDAYYNRVVTAADTARSRAQSAYAIASAIAGALVGAALLSNLASVATWIKLVGVGALACWLIASSLYIRAVSRTVPVPTGPQPDPDALVRAVMENVETERWQIESWYNWANKISLLAMLMTAAAFVAALLSGIGAEHRHGTIVLTATGVQALAGTCDLHGQTVSGEIKLRSLNTDFVEIASDASQCRGKRLDLRIAKAQIITMTSERPSR